MAEIGHRGQIGNKKRIRLFVLIGLIGVIGLIGLLKIRQAEAAWYSTSWAFRKKLVIDNAKVSGSGNLTNFPVLVSTTDTDLKQYAQSDGDDILFTSSDGSTKLDHEIETYTSSTGQLIAWVEIPTLSYATDTEIYLYYGNPGASSQQSANGTFAAANNYQGVWHLKEDPSGGAPQMTDSTVNANNGTSAGSMTTSDQVTGKVDGSLDFDGTDDYIQIGQGPNGIKSVSFWVNPESASQHFINISGNTEYIFVDNGTVNAVGIDNPAIYVNGEISSTLASNQWQYVVVAFETAKDASGLYFGKTAQDNYLKGSLDEVRLNNTVLSSDWIKTEYTNQNDPSSFVNISRAHKGPNSPASPVLFWKFNEATGSTAYDASTYTNNGTLGTGTSAPTWNTTSFIGEGASLKFDGSNDYVSKSYSTDSELDVGTASFTVDLWFNHPSTAPAGGSTDTLISRASGTLGSEVGYKIYMNSSGYICFGIDDTAGSFPSDSACSTTSYADSNWHHLEGVKNGITSITLYIDGVQIAQDASLSATSSISGSSPTFYVGVDSDGSSNPWDGWIDEVRVFDSLRTAADVKTDFASRGSVRGLSASFGDSQLSEKLNEGLIGYWKMDESSGNASDSSGNGTTLTNVSTTAFVGGKFGNAADPDGTADYFQTSDNTALSITGDLTISSWINPDTISAGSYDIAGKWDYISDAAHESYLLQQSADEIVVYIDSSSSYVTTNAVNLSATGGWYHVTATYKASSGTVTVFVNGEPAATTTTGTIPTSIGNDTDRFHIGAEDSSTAAANFYNGQIDDIRIYNRALSPAEVRQLADWGPPPVGEWKLDENTGTSAYDTSGNANTGSFVNSPVWSTGKLGSALQFDGIYAAGDLVNVTKNSIINDLTVKTMEAWINTDTSYGSLNQGMIISKQWNSVGWYLGLCSNGNCGDGAINKALIFRQSFDSNTQKGQWLTPNLSISANTWVHVAVTYDNSSVNNDPTFYINGVKQTVTEVFAPSGTRDSEASRDLRIGDTQQYNGFIGKLDDVRIYNYVRTPKQIIEDMWARGPSASGGNAVSDSTPVGYWHFDEGYGTTAYDSSPNANNVTLSTASWTNSGKFGKAFNGATNIRLSIADDPDLDFAASEDFSISLWFKSDSATNPSANEYLVEKGGNIATDAIGYAIYTSSSSDGLICFGIDDDATSFPEDSVCSTTDLYDNTWHYLLAKKTGTSRLDLYVDGKANGTPDVSISATGTLENSAVFYVGDTNATDGTDEFLGDIDELKVYRAALNEEEIKVEYNRGKSAVLGALGTNTTYQPQAANQEYCVPGDATSCASPVAEWKLDENTGQYAYDSSTSGNTGTLGTSSSPDSSDPAWTAGKYGSGLNFDGSNDYVIATLDGTSLTQLTVEFWANPVIPASGQRGIFQWANQLSTGTPFIYIYVNSNSKIGYYVDGGYRPYAGFSFTGGKWNHFALTLDSNNLWTFYINGIATSTYQDDSAHTSQSNAAGVYFGNGYDGYLNTKIDNAHVYNYARTPAQIAWDYNRGKPQWNLKLDQTSGTAAYDSGPMATNGTLQNNAAFDTTSGNCKFDYCVDLDGTNDYILTGSFSPLAGAASTTTQASWGGWYYLTTSATSKTLMEKATELKLSTDSNSKPLCQMYTGGAFAPASPSSLPAALSTSTWYHVFCTYDGTNIKTYVNGMLSATNAQAGNITAASSAAYVGVDSSQNGDVTGRVDEQYIYNFALTEAQVKEVYNGSSAVGFQ